MNLTTARQQGLRTLAELLVLEGLEAGAVPVTSLAKRYGLSPSVVSRVAYLLSLQGLVQFTEKPTDRRVRLASLTTKGRKLFALAA